MFLLEGPPIAVTRIFLGVFAPGVYNRKNQKGPIAIDNNRAAPVDDIAADAQAEYRERTSKWIAACLTTVVDPLFWFVLGASHRARGPIRHLFNILSEYGTANRTTPASHLPIVDLTTRRLQQLEGEFDDLLRATAGWTADFVGDLRRMEGLMDWPIDDQMVQLMHSFAVQLLIHNKAGFTRRIVNLLNRRRVSNWPHSLPLLSLLFV